MTALATESAVRTFTLPKRTGTYGDALAAFGLQRLLAVLSGRQFSIEDTGSDYALHAPEGAPVDLDTLDYASLRHTAGYRYLRQPGDTTPNVAQEIDYAEQRRLLLDWRAARKQYPKPTEEQRQQLDALRPMPNWMLYQNVDDLQGFGGYVALHRAIRAADQAQLRAAVRAELSQLAGLPATAPPPIANVSAVQVFNPTVGKGVSGVKPKGTGLAGLPGYFVDWFEEWLRYAGLAVAATAVATGTNLKDRKVYVLAPKALDGAAVTAVGERFAALGSAPTSAKADVLLAIRLARELITLSDVGQPAGPAVIRFRRRRPNQIIAGLRTAYFKSLSRFARALSNIAFVGLPGWFPVDAESKDDWLATLEEHERILRPLDEERAEEAALLACYRDILSAGPELIPALLAFLGGYAIHVFRSRERGRYAPALSTPGLLSFLRRLFMDQKPELAPILEDQGFRRVAAAIRRATVTEQFFKANKQQEYEIHYGLLQELERKARFKDQFIAQLSDFIVSYNTENARKAEQAGQSGRQRRQRPQVTTEDVAGVVRLLDGYPTETVAMLLLAYASSRDPRTPAAQGAEPAPEPEGEDVESADA